MTSDTSYPHGGRRPLSADTTGEISDHEPVTDWRRLHEMESDAAVAEDPDASPLDEASWEKAHLVGKPSKASLSAARFQRTVTRVTVEACWLHRYQTAISQLQNVEAVGTDFFRVAFSALLDGRLLRLIRLLEENPRCASFWYLHRVNPDIVEISVRSAGIDLKMLKEMSTKLRSVRNSTFVHIDKHEVFNPQKVYRDASISVQDLEIVCVKLEKIMKQIYLVIFHKIFESEEYDDADIKKLARLRDRTGRKAAGKHKVSQ